MITVLVADDQEMVRAGLRQILSREPEIEVVGEASDGREALDGARALRPDVCLLDVRMPELTGIDVARELARDPDPPAVVMITTFDHDEYLFAALQAGAVGFVLKDASSRTLIEAVMVATAGEALISPALTRRLIDRYVARPPEPQTAGLTEREVEVLAAVATGKTNRELADELFISLGTTKGHLASLMRKTGSRNRVELVIWAFEHSVGTT